jgi:hypothetical protein
MSPRTPSIVSRTCKLITRRPGTGKTNSCLLHTRTVSPSVHPRPASDGATNFFLASALHAPRDLAASRRERRAMRPTDICHPNETTCTRTSYVPGSLSPLSRRGRPTESSAPYGMTGGPDVFTTSVNASAERRERVTSCRLPHGLPSRAWAFSSHGADCDRASDTPVAPCRSPSRLPHLRGGCMIAASSALGLGARVGECGLAPRSPVSASRERNAS